MHWFSESLDDMNSFLNILVSFYLDLTLKHFLMESIGQRRIQIHGFSRVIPLEEDVISAFRNLGKELNQGLLWENSYCQLFASSSLSGNTNLRFSLSL